jgi:CubicO group peptidase (beta-lactamase class C family)
MNELRFRCFSVALVVTTFLTPVPGSEPHAAAGFPAESWTHVPPENLGYSSEGLADARRYFEKIGGHACVVVKSGFVIAAWGDVTKPIPNYSIRKSYLNALLGIEYGKGRLRLDASLAELEIDDKGGLTDGEKSAHLRHLLTSTSGVFHEAAYESKEQKGARPPRGSFEPGEFFYYNNWDFNVLGRIYSNVSDEDLFAAFSRKIADILDMEDFDLSHTSYAYDDVSEYPAYRFASSARDDARFGYLYLRDGRWGDRQVVPEEWVRLSLSRQVVTGDHYYYDYGFLWWVDAARGQAFARGNSGQYIGVLPEQDMVIVFRADPGSIVNKWLGRRVKPQESFLLIPKILAAKKD